MKVLRRDILSKMACWIILASLLWVPACTGANLKSKTVTVASKDFTEQFILGEMYAQILEANGFNVSRKLNLGGTPVAHQALLNEEIDLYPEYTGTGLLTVLKEQSSFDQKAVYEVISREYLKEFDLVWLDPAPMNNTQALAMTQEGSKKFAVTTISQMVTKANQLVMVGPPEFREREDGLPGLKAVYGDFQLKEYKDVDTGLRYQVLLTGDADVAVAFGTDGEISAYNLVVLRDDMNLFPPYQVAPVVRKAVLDKYPEIGDILNQLSPLLTDDVMRSLNYKVSGEGQEPAKVAHDFLVEQGLIPAS